jgi:hypothetical protein
MTDHLHSFLTHVGREKFDAKTSGVISPFPQNTGDKRAGTTYHDTTNARHLRHPGWSPFAPAGGASTAGTMWRGMNSPIRPITGDKRTRTRCSAKAASPYGNDINSWRPAPHGWGTLTGEAPDVETNEERIGGYEARTGRETSKEGGKTAPFNE